MAPISLPGRWTNRLRTPALRDGTNEGQRDVETLALRPSVPLSLILSIVLLLFLSACAASTQPVVKIGLVAPFEGRYRQIGYEAIYAARLAQALREMGMETEAQCDATLARARRWHDDCFALARHIADVHPGIVD